MAWANQGMQALIPLINRIQVRSICHLSQNELNSIFRMPSHNLAHRLTLTYRKLLWLADKVPASLRCWRTLSGS